MYIYLLKGDLLWLIQPNKVVFLILKKYFTLILFKWEYNQYILNGKIFVELKFNATYHEYMCYTKQVQFYKYLKHYS